MLQKNRDRFKKENIGYWNGFDPFSVSIFKDDKNKELLISGNFNIAFSFNYGLFSDKYFDWNRDTSYSLYMPFDIGLIPNGDTINDFNKISSELSSHESSGIYWISTLYLEVNTANHSGVNPSGNYSYEGNDEFISYFNDRKDALRFKRLVISGIDGVSSFGVTKHDPKGITGEINKFFNHVDGNDEWLSNGNLIDPKDYYNDNDSCKKY